MESYNFRRVRYGLLGIRMQRVESRVIVLLKISKGRELRVSSGLDS